MSSTSQALLFLVQNIFSLYIYIVLLRFMLQLAKADFYNPLSQFIIKSTNPLLKPLRRIIPPIKGQDIAALLLAYLLYMLLITLFELIRSGTYVPLQILLTYSFGGLINSLTDVYLFAIIISAILSWIPSTHGHPATQLLWQLVEPLLAPVRKILPDMGGIDLSPLVVLLILQVVRIFLHPIVPF